MGSDTVVLAAVLAGTGAGVAADLRTRRIPNGITLAMAALGIALAATGTSGLTIGGAALGFLVGLLLMLPGHALGATGAGDVKLMAAVGTILGPRLILTAFLYTAIAGALLALAYAVSRGQLGPILRRTARLATGPSQARRAIESPAALNRFPYGPAIAAGSVLAALSGG